MAFGYVLARGQSSVIALHDCAPGLGVDLDRDAVERLANNQVRESVFYDDIQGEAPRVGQIL